MVIYEQLGRYNEALAYARNTKRPGAIPRLGLALRARMNARLRKRREATEALRTLEKTSVPGNEHVLASVYASLGDNDRAIAELQKAVEKRSMLPFPFADPQLDPLRSNPRFQQMVRRVGLPL